MCLPRYKTFICASRGFLSLHWENAPMNEQLSLHAHIDVRTCGRTPKYGQMTGKIINAASQNQATSNVQQSTHLKLTVYVCQTFITCHCTKFILVLPWNPSQYVCFGRMCGREWLKGCIDRLESTGTNLYCVSQYNGFQTQGRGWACVCGYMSTSWVFMWVCGLIYSMLVSVGVVLSYCVSACSENQ